MLVGNFCGPSLSRLGAGLKGNPKVQRSANLEVKVACCERNDCRSRADAFVFPPQAAGRVDRQNNDHNRRSAADQFYCAVVSPRSSAAETATGFGRPNL